MQFLPILRYRDTHKEALNLNLKEQDLLSLFLASSVQDSAANTVCAPGGLQRYQHDAPLFLWGASPSWVNLFTKSSTKLNIDEMFLSL